MPETRYLAEATARLIATAQALPEGAQAAPSRCPGWTRGHVLTHLARNAEGLGHLITWATSGIQWQMYVGPHSREHGIEEGAGRPMAELIADVRATADELAGKLPLLLPYYAHIEVDLPSGHRVPAGAIPFLRMREVCYHHTDLDAGFTFADIPPPWLGNFLDEEVDRLRDHPAAPALRLLSDEGDDYPIGAGEHPATVSGSRAALVGWLARGSTEGLTADPLPTLPDGR